MIDTANLINERQLIFHIGRIARSARSVEEALGRIESLLAHEVGAATLILRPAESGTPFLAGSAISQFLESRDFPFRGVYTAPLGRGSRSDATLVACFRGWGAPGEVLKRATSHTAERLSEVAARTGRPAGAVSS